MIHKVGGAEIVVDRQVVAGGEVYSLEVRSKSSLDYSSVVLNLNSEELGELVVFLRQFEESK